MMKTIYAAACVSLLSACGGAGSSVTQDPFVTQDALFDASTLSQGPATTVNTGVDDTNFASILNGLRVSRDLETVSYDARLDQAAQKHAQDMVNLGYFSHTSADGRSLRDRIEAEGYDPRGWAENIARGHQSQGQVLQAWIDSPGHDRNLSANLEEFALGAAGTGSQLTWVLVLATERD